VERRDAPGAPLLLFDLGGVLVENAGFDALGDLLAGHGRDKLDAGALRTRWLESEAVRRFELGEINPSTFAQLFLNEWGLDLAPDAFLDRFSVWPRGFYPGVADLLQRLRATHRVCCLSNSNVVHWRRLDACLQHFDRAYASHLIGKIKPDRDVFAAVIEDLGISPYSIYFFDDSAPNVQTARDIGLRAFHTDGFAELTRRLHALHIL
jgi:putative hydrolase of the HAD superfamily